MRRGRKGGAAAVLLAVAGWLPVLPAGAQPEVETSFSRSPDRGMPGTVITVSGTGCETNGRPWEYAYVYFYSTSNESGQDFRATSGHFPIKSDGTWDGHFTVPTNAPLGDYTVWGDCVASDMVRECGRAAFTVGEPLRASTTTTVSTTTTTAPPPTTATIESRARRTSTTTALTTTTTTTTEAPVVTTTTGGLLEAASNERHTDDDDGGPPWAAAVGVPVLGGAAVFLARRRHHAADRDTTA